MKYLGRGAIRQLPFMDLFDLILNVALRVDDFSLDEIVDICAVSFGPIHLPSSALCCAVHDASASKDKL